MCQVVSSMTERTWEAWGTTRCLTRLDKRPGCVLPKHSLGKTDIHTDARTTQPLGGVKAESHAFTDITHQQDRRSIVQGLYGGYVNV